MGLKYYQLLIGSKLLGISIDDLKKMDNNMQMIIYNNTNDNIKNIIGGIENDDKGKTNRNIQRGGSERTPIYCGKNRNARFSKTRINC